MKDHYVMEVDWKGVQDTHIDNLPRTLPIERYMMNKGYKRVKNSAILFKKGNSIRYVIYGGDKHPETHPPKIQDYYDTFKL